MADQLHAIADVVVPWKDRRRYSSSRNSRKTTGKLSPHPLDHREGDLQVDASSACARSRGRWPAPPHARSVVMQPVIHRRHRLAPGARYRSSGCAGEVPQSPESCNLEGRFRPRSDLSRNGCSPRTLQMRGRIAFGFVMLSSPGKERVSGSSSARTAELRQCGIKLIDDLPGYGLRAPLSREAVRSGHRISRLKSSAASCP